jgi:hypothetical protein
MKQGQYTGLLAEDGHRDRLAATNVRRVMSTFLILDIWCALTYGYQFATVPTPEQFDKQLALQTLPACLAFAFSVDVILAAIFFCILDMNDPIWGDYSGVVSWNWLSNAVTFSILVAQQIAVAEWSRSMPIVLSGMIFLAIRGFKLRPMYMLNRQLQSIPADSQDDGATEELWTFWAQDHSSSSWEKKIAQCVCTVSLAVIALTFVFMATHSEPTGAPPPPPALASSNSSHVLTLAGDPPCDCYHCMVDDKWFVCSSEDCTSAPNSVVVSHGYDAPEAEGEMMAGAGVGAAVCIGAPYAMPFCALAGAAVGGVAENYKVNGYHWCEAPQDIPFTASSQLWCAQPSRQCP